MTTPERALMIANLVKRQLHTGNPNECPIVEVPWSATFAASLSLLEGWWHPSTGGIPRDRAVVLWAIAEYNPLNGKFFTLPELAPALHKIRTTPTLWLAPTATTPPVIGVKEHEGKLRWSLLPLDALREVVKVLEFGAKKYSKDNWKKVEGARDLYFDAALRHLTSWYEGEDADQETGLHHLAHAACDVLFLVSMFPVTAKKV